MNLPQNIQKPRISEGFLSDSFELAQLHFHWGMDDTLGSEHAFDGKHYPLEMHMVHVNVNAHPDGTAQVGQVDDTYLVLSVIFQVDIVPSANPLQQLEEVLSHVIDLNATSTLTELDLLQLMPTDLATYVSY